MLVRWREFPRRRYAPLSESLCSSPPLLILGQQNSAAGRVMPNLISVGGATELEEVDVEKRADVLLGDAPMVERKRAVSSRLVVLCLLCEVLMLDVGHI